jgi:hypothetical protein
MWDIEGQAAGAARHRKGAWGELIASAWLLEQGYEVFRSVTPTGPIDLVAVNSEHILLFDVKVVRTYRKNDGSVGIHGKSQKSAMNDRQQAMNVQPLFVTEDGICGLSLKHLKGQYAKVRAIAPELTR